MNIAKTESTVIGSRQRLSTSDDRVTVDCELVRQVNSTKTLGLTLDQNIRWKNLIDTISKKVSFDNGALNRLRGLIDRKTAIKVYKGFIEPYFSYCAQYGTDSESL